MSTKPIEYADASARVRAVYDDIMATVVCSRASSLALPEELGVRQLPGTECAELAPEA
jgi:hypothetical protein